MLSTIMKWLDAMDNKLNALDPLREKVTALEASIEELDAQPVTLTTVVEQVDIAHMALNTNVNRIEAGQRASQQD
jgi:hypothetical protein